MNKDYRVFGDVLSAARIGSWKIEVDDGCEPRMYADETMMELVGVPSNADISPEELYHAWYDNVDPKHYDAVAEGVDHMAHDQLAEIQYPWHHPDGRTIIVRCGGIRDKSYTKGLRVAGIHQWVTTMKHVDRDLEAKDRQLIEFMEALKTSNLHEKLRADTMDFILKNENIQEFAEYFSSRLLELYECDQVIYRDLDGREIIKERSGATRINLSICKDCPHSKIDSPVYTNGCVVMEDSKLGTNGIPTHLDCPVKSILSYLVYQGKKTFGYISLHYIAKAHRFTEEEKNSLDRIAKLMTLVLTRKKQQDEIKAKDLRAELLKKLIKAEYWNYIVNSKNEIIKLEASNQLAEFLNQDPATIFGDPNSWRKIIHPEDLDPTNSAFIATVSDHSGKTPYNVSYRMVDKDGKYNWYQSAGSVIRKEDGSGEFFGILINTTSSVEKELEQRRQYEEAQALEKANKAKSFFFSTVSHDIRTPLNAIIGYSELLKNGINDKEEQNKALNAITTSGTTLLELINDVLDLSKLEAGKMEINSEMTDVNPLASGVLNSFNVAVSTNKTDLIIEAPELPLLNIDPQRIRQILFNLIGNAVKFTEHGSITLRVDFTPNTDGTNTGCLVFAVADTGCGISPENLKKLMNPFVQLQNFSKAKGTGLGLAICKQLAIKMGGQLTIDSVLGKGSTFKLTLPNVMYTMEKKQDKEEKQAHASALHVSATINQNMRILIVDDVAVNRSVIKAMLKGMKITNVITAENGIDALNKLNENPDGFDLVLTDMWMPEMDGNGLISEIRKNSHWDNLPVYSVTADVEAQKSYEASGFSGILLKPITLEKLRVVINKVSA